MIPSKPTSKAKMESRGSLPKWFFTPKDCPGENYLDDLIKGKLRIDFSVKGENANDCRKKLQQLISECLSKSGFKAIDEAMMTQFCQWRYQRPQRPGAALSKMLGVYSEGYSCATNDSLVKSLQGLAFLNDRTQGKMIAQVRQIIIKTRMAGGSFDKDTFSFKFYFEPCIVGSVRWDDREIKEEQIGSTHGFSKVFDPSIFLEKIKTTLNPLSSHPGITIKSIEQSHTW